jgi:dUTP pyrophosphatase
VPCQQSWCEYTEENPLKVKIKKLHPSAVIPEYSRTGDAGLDLTSVDKTENAMYIEYDTYIAVEIPEGYVGLLYPRSSISKYHLLMANSVGVVDSNYRGSIKIRFKKTSTNAYETVYNIGDRVAQLIIMPYPTIEFQEVEDVSETERGEGAFGSSGS